jgi:hypothetical protein
MNKTELEELQRLTEELMFELKRPALELQKAKEAAFDQLAQDALTMALRLYGEDEKTFAPETAEVMKRWRPAVEKYLRGEL